ncbi:MAG: hypothetical protein IMZ52_05220 [Actinobacteria bacterium]|nr:hypothetical protein [Actinomycetota bacterium]MBE3114611.1 hypothetical protein [Actinomycetota bacterium]
MSPTADGQSLKIFMPSAGATNYIQCWCTRFDEDGYNVVIETFLGSANRNLLFSHVVPGAVSEQYNVLGKPHFIDSTYSQSNTLWLECISGYGLSSVRTSREISCKSISDSFITPNYFNVKIEGVRLS